MVRTRARTRTLLVALALATLATVLTAAPAHAEEVKQQTHLVSQFNSGHTGWVKIALEKNTSTNESRAHVGVWCQNASGTKVQCGAVQFSGTLEVEYWHEGYGWDRSAQWDYVSELDTDPPLTVNKYNPWFCTLEGPDQYRAIIYGVRIQDAFGQWGGWKDRTHPTYTGTFC
jgi:hypothetical protein